MKKSILLFLLLIIMIKQVNCGIEKDIVGFWKTLDEKKEFITSIIVSYIHENKLYGRVIVSFDEKTGKFIESYMNPSQIANKVEGSPLLLELDIFYDLVLDDDKYINGIVLDPRNGRTYRAEAWIHEKDLVLRGKIGPFGLNTIFLPAYESDFPDFVKIPSLFSFTPYRNE